ALDDKNIIFYLSNYKIQENIPIISIPIKEINKLVAKSFQLDENISSDIERLPTQSSNENNTREKENIKDKNRNEETSDLPQQKRVALTFDDGPDPIVTTRILKTLDKYDAKATFFMLGSRV